LGSGFGLIVSERFDPRTAKRSLGRIAGAGTAGGLLSAILAERVAALGGAAAMLPFLAAFHLVSAWQIHLLAIDSDSGTGAKATSLLQRAPAARSGLRVLADAPYLRNLAALVLLGTTSAGLVDYLFKVEAVKTFGRGDNLLRFFAMYYAATSLITFVVQTSSTRRVLERFGLALTASTPSYALLGASIGGLARRVSSMVFAAARRAVFRGCCFARGESCSHADQRPTNGRRRPYRRRFRSARRCGQWPCAASGASGCDISGHSVGRHRPSGRRDRGRQPAEPRLHRHPERSLLNRAVELDLSDVEDGTGLMVRTLRLPGRFGAARRRRRQPPRGARRHVGGRPRPRSAEIYGCAPGPRTRHRRAGRVDDPTPSCRTRSLAWDPAADAVFALRVAEEHVGNWWMR
jgi:hypothetical protein